MTTRNKYIYFKGPAGIVQFALRTNGLKIHNGDRRGLLYLLRQAGSINVGQSVKNCILFHSTALCGNAVFKGQKCHVF